MGLDIRNDAIAAVVVNSSIKGRFIERYARVPLNGELDADERLTKALEFLNEELDFSGSACAIALPAHMATFSNVQIPFRDNRKIRQVLPFELESNLARPVGDLAIDFQTIPSEEAPLVLAAAMERKTIQALLSVLAGFQLDPLMISVGAFPTAVCLSRLTNIPAKAILVDSDAQMHTLYLLQEGRIHLVRSFKRGITPQTDMQSLCMNIQRTIIGHNENFDAQFEPQKLFLTGYGIDAPAAEQKISAQMQLPVERIDRVSDPDDLLPLETDETWNPWILQNARALAVAELDGQACINFHRTKTSIKRYWTENRTQLITTAVLMAVVLLLYFGSMIYDGITLGKEAAKLDQRIHDVFKSTFPDVTRIVDPVQQMRVKIEEKKRSVVDPTAGEGAQRTIDALNEISRLLPKELDIEMTQIVFSEDNILISGTTNTFNAVDDMKNRLEASDLFESATISSANTEKTGNRVRFKLKIIPQSA